MPEVATPLGKLKNEARDSCAMTAIDLTASGGPAGSAARHSDGRQAAMSPAAVHCFRGAPGAGQNAAFDDEEPGLARDCALQLLARSIEFDHGRIAVVRLSIAAQAGADIPEPHWRYCRRVVDACSDRTLKALLARAEGRGARAGLHFVQPGAA